MPLVVRAFPLLGSRSQLEAFAAALRGERANEAAQFYRHYGLTHESWHLQDTPQGPWVIAVSQIENPEEAGARYAQASAHFTLGSKLRSCRSPELIQTQTAGASDARGVLMVRRRAPSARLIRVSGPYLTVNRTRRHMPCSWRTSRRRAGYHQR